MTNMVLLNNIDHADLTIGQIYGAEYGDAVNQTLVLPAELEDVQREYPIVVRKDADGAFQTIALLGIDRDQNLFLDGSQWRARHVPMIHQRGPFYIGRPAGEAAEPMIHIDLEDARIGGPDAQPLFRAQGGNAPYLDHVARILTMIHDGRDQMRQMLAAIDAAGLLAPAKLELNLDDVETIGFPDVWTVRREALSALSSDKLHALATSGWLAHAVFIAASLGNMPDLARRYQQARAGE